MRAANDTALESMIPVFSLLFSFSMKSIIHVSSLALKLELSHTM